MTNLEQVAVALSRDGEVRQSGDSYSVRCPAHDDNNPSLTVSERRDGEGVVVKCYRGCTAADIVAAKNLTMADLFYNRASSSVVRTPRPSKQRTSYATPQDAFGAARRGITKRHGGFEQETVSPYYNGEPEPFGFAARFDLPDGKKVFKQISRNASGRYELTAGIGKWPLYRQNELPAEGDVFVSEGEKAADAGWLAGLPSVTSKGGSQAANQSDWSALAGRNVVILPDNDDAGEKYAAAVVGILQGLTPPATVKIVRLPGRPDQGGDIADLAAECQDDDELVGLRQTVEILADEAEPEVADEQEADTLPRLMLQSFEEIESRAVDWLWPMRIVAGGLTILTGPVGNTKSMLTIDLAARVSLGTKHPDGTGACPAGKVLMFGHEDAVNEVVKPRLVAAGANCANVFFVPGKIRDPNTTDPDEAERVLFSEDVGTLRRTLEDNPGIKLLIFDPLPEFIRGDHNAAAEVREALMPLSRLAQEFGVAIVAVCHQNKKVGLSAVQTIAGSGGFVQVARTVLAVINDPEDTETGFTRRRLMVVAKSNYGGNNEAQAYRLIERMNGQAAIEWLPGVLEVNADEILRPNKNGGGGGDGRQTADLDGAVELVLEIMGRPGTQCSSEAELEMRNAGHSRHTVKDAKTTAGVISKRVGGAGGSGSWEWAWKDGKGPREPGQPAVTGEPVPIDEWKPLDF